MSLDNGALVFNRSDAVTFAGVVSGSGTLAQIGPNILTLVGDQYPYRRDQRQRGNARGRERSQSRRRQRRAHARWRPPADHAPRSPAPGPLTLAAGGGTIDNGGFADLFSGALTGPGALTVTGAGSVTLAADNSYTGGTTIAAGTLRLGNGGATGSVTGDVANNGTLVFDRSNALVFDGVDQRQWRARPAGHRHDHADRGEQLCRRRPASPAAGCWSTARSRAPPRVASGARLGGTGTIAGHGDRGRRRAPRPRAQRRHADRRLARAERRLAARLRVRPARRRRRRGQRPRSWSAAR